ncbi:MAG: hypothetical protein ABIV10_09585 [Gemmatimonadaceae bacterium]
MPSPDFIEESFDAAVADIAPAAAVSLAARSEEEHAAPRISNETAGMKRGLTNMEHLGNVV